MKTYTTLKIVVFALVCLACALALASCLQPVNPLDFGLNERDREPPRPPDPPSRAVTGVRLVPDYIALNIGETRTLTPIIMPPNAENQNVAWDPKNPDIVFVNGGEVEARDDGVGLVVVITEEGGFTAPCVVESGDPNGVAVFFVTVGQGSFNVHDT